MRARPSPTDTRSRVGLLAALAAGTALVTAGCSLGTQTSSLTAVSGDRVALVRAAAQDILMILNAASTTSQISSARTKARNTWGACMTADPMGRRGRRAGARFAMAST